MKTQALVISAVALLSFAGLSQAEAAKDTAATPSAVVKEQAQGAVGQALPTATVATPPAIAKELTQNKEQTQGTVGQAVPTAKAEDGLALPTPKEAVKPKSDKAADKAGVKAGKAKELIR